MSGNAEMRLPGEGWAAAVQRCHVEDCVLNDGPQDPTTWEDGANERDGLNRLTHKFTYLQTWLSLASVGLVGCL